MFTNIFPYTDFHELNLDTFILKFKEFIVRMDGLDEWRVTHEEEYQELKKLYDDILAGNFPESMVNSLKKWVEVNGVELIGEMIKTVFFGITDSGYFVAYIPDSWDEIQFGTTGLDDFPVSVDYGHLTLSY